MILVGKRPDRTLAGGNARGAAAEAAKAPYLN